MLTVATAFLEEVHFWDLIFLMFVFLSFTVTFLPTSTVQDVFLNFTDAFFAALAVPGVARPEIPDPVITIAAARATDNAFFAFFTEKYLLFLSHPY